MAQLREELKSEEAKQQRINEAIRQKQPESVKLTDRIRRNECVFVLESRIERGFGSATQPSRVCAASNRRSRRRTALWRRICAA